MQHFALEEEDSGKRLVLGGGGDVALGRQVGEEGADFGRPHLAGMPFVVEADEAFDPVDVGFFGVQGVVFGA